jgi:preprotein translocase subunit SecE
MIEGPDFSEGCDNNKRIHEVGRCSERERTLNILLIIAAVLAILWLLGFVIPGFSFGGLIHILVVIAAILLIIWLVQFIMGRRAL